MNENHTNNAARILRLVCYGMLLCATVVLLASGCGDLGLTGGESGGGTVISGVGTGGTGVVKAATRITAADSGLVGAIVFVDTNGNRLPDPGEPSAVTDRNGAFDLQLDTAEAASCPLLMQAIAGKTVIKATGLVVADSYIVQLEQ